jgi:Thoeris protein ThsB, TIR-like domain
MKHTIKVFVSYDYDQDKVLKDLLIGQAHNPQCPFEIIDGSLKEAAPEAGWEKKAAVRMRKADLVVVLVGADTHRAPGVLKEVSLARKLGKRVVQLIGHKDGHHPRVKGGGVLYKWTWQNLEKILY